MADVLVLIVGITLFAMFTSCTGNDMCQPVTVERSMTYSLTYQPIGKDCCCSLLLANDSLKLLLDITVNATYFVLIYPNSTQERIPRISPRNVEVMNSTKVCATRKFNSRMINLRGAMNISGNAAFKVQCNAMTTANVTIIINTTPVSDDVSTFIHASSTSAVKYSNATTSLEDSTTTVKYPSTPVSGDVSTFIHASSTSAVKYSNATTSLEDSTTTVKYPSTPVSGDVSTFIHASSTSAVKYSNTTTSLEDSTTTVKYSATAVSSSETTTLNTKRKTTQDSVSKGYDTSHDEVTWIVVGAVAGAMVIIAVIIGGVIWRKRSQYTDLERRSHDERLRGDIIMADNDLFNQGNSQVIYSLAQNTDHVNPMSMSDNTTAEGDGNGLMMTDNCLYNHQEGQGGQSPDIQTQKQTSGRQGQSGADNHHREDPDFSHIYAKVNK